MLTLERAIKGLHRDDAREEAPEAVGYRQSAFVPCFGEGAKLLDVSAAQLRVDVTYALVATSLWLSICAAMALGLMVP